MTSPGTAQRQAAGFPAYAQGFRDLGERLDNSGPVWTKDLRDHAWVKFTELGFPTARRGNESWKYTNVRPIASARFDVPLDLEPEGVLDPAGLRLVAPWDDSWVNIVFVDGLFSAGLSTDGKQAGDAQAASLLQAIATNGSLVQEPVEWRPGPEELAEATGRKYVQGPSNPFLAGNEGTVNPALVNLPGLTSRRRVLPTQAVATANRGGGGGVAGVLGRPYEKQIEDHTIICGTPKTVIPKIRHVLEYLRPFLFGRLGWNRLGGNLVISGAFGLFRSEAVVDIGGYAHDAIGEDMELIMRLRTRSYERKVCHRVEFIPDPVAWTQVPESLRALGGQRDRWHRGLAEVLWRYRRALLNPRYGALGMVVFPYFLFVELLAPAVEALGLLVIIAGFALGIVNLPFASLFLLVAYGYGLILTASTLVMEEVNYHRHDGFKDRLLLVTWAILENFGYRQINVFWRLKGLVRFVLGRTDWGAIERQRFNSPKAQPDTANL